MLFISVLILTTSVAWPQSTKGRSRAKTDAAKARGTTEPEVLLNPAMFLMRDPNVQTELQLQSAQKGAIDDLAQTINDPLWRLRDVVSSDTNAGSAEIGKANEFVEGKLHEILTKPQYERIEQIAFRSLGPQALLQAKVAEQLGLNSAQREKMSKHLEESRSAIKTARGQGSVGAADVNRKIEKLRSDLKRNLLATLSPTQKTRWNNMQGQPFDLSQVQPMTAQAPELRDIETWINSKPLKLADLRGQVVAVHFWTFGCINCVHNYPWYKGWHARFRGKGLTIIGIHTPETPGEKTVNLIRQKATENELLFPIAVDNEAKNWQAWGNTMWPSVYLVDKKGKVRYWWYGELNWQGADGEKFMREKIEELLAEK